MERYDNLSGDSGVHAFEIGADNIHVRFTTGSTYVYNYSIPGASEVEQMKVLAKNGSGLNSFINKYVKKRYFGKY
jgi:hypothetical protein